MRKMLLIFALLVCAQSFAQNPIFKAETGLDSDVYAYTSLRINNNSRYLNTYTTIQYKAGKSIFVGLDFSTGRNESYLGFVFRLARDYSPYFKLGVEVTPSFILDKTFNLSNTYLNVYMNGAITRNEKLYWLSNTHYYSVDFHKNRYYQYTYLAYNFDIIKDLSITPMIGENHEWYPFTKLDLAAALKVQYKQFALSAHICDIIKSRPVIRIAASASF